MMRWGNRQALVVLLAAVAAPVAMIPAIPAMAGVTGDVVSHPGAITAAQQRAVAAYWTRKRIAAIDHDTRKPTRPAPPANDPLGAEWRNGGAIATVGRLFFTAAGTDSSCTATVVKSANQSTVVTAAHCLIHESKWVTNLYLIPGYRDGATRPRTQPGFTGRRAIISRGYLQGKLDKHDVGFIVTNPGPGRRPITKTTGAQRIGFGRQAEQLTYMFGYPRYSEWSDTTHAGRPAFLGERLAACRGKSKARPGWAQHRGLPCMMGWGASGGPSLTGFDPVKGTGTVVGVSSGREEIGGKAYLFGDYFNNPVVKALYSNAQR